MRLDVFSQKIMLMYNQSHEIRGGFWMLWKKKKKKTLILLRNGQQNDTKFNVGRKGADVGIGYMKTLSRLCSGEEFS